MFFVYSLQSTVDNNRYYIGLTLNIEQRLKEHNAGKSIHTNKYRPWTLVCYVAFSSQEKATAFENYLKSCSGRAFSKKHF